MSANSAGLTTLLSARVKFQSIFCIIVCNLYLHLLTINNRFHKPFIRLTLKE